MCGISGIISVNKNEVNHTRLHAMTDAVAHRGPDGEGHWVSKNGHVALGHRRLAIIDLSQAANQPMHFLEKYTIVFNGEIYNYIELKETLTQQGYSFKTQSDTEVLLALYDKYKENCLQHLDGMFSFVIYNQIENEIFAARDRFGEKPFYYSYLKGQYFLFGSEMKCLWAAGIKKEVNNKMLFNYLLTESLQNSNNTCETFYENCVQLPHSHFIKFSVNDIKVDIKKYYDVDYNHIDSHISENDASKKLNELFYTSLNRRLRSDVPIGSCLSGGLDSSIIVSAIQKINHKKTFNTQHSFSAIFPGFEKNEKKYIDEIVDQTNVQPHFTTPTADDFLKYIDKICWHQEEPFGSTSIYAQFAVMQLAKQNNVKVLLDGQGADEIAAGYKQYFLPFFNELKKANKGLFATEMQAYKNLYGNFNFKDKIKMAANNHAATLTNTYKKFQYKIAPFIEKEFYNEYSENSFPLKIQQQNLNQTLYHSTFKDGLQELLRYADRNSMAHGVEVRLPFLNHDLVEFLFNLPSHFKLKNGFSKWIFRQTFESVLPKSICWRKDKIGFETPQQNWLQQPKIKEKIIAAKEKLINQKILKPNTNLQKLDWRIWMASELI